MIHKAIRHLKTRPHHERRGVALIVALAVVIILFLLWAVFFVRGLRAQSAVIDTATTPVVIQ
jgi:Tfp pilus assembly protein PilX